MGAAVAIADLEPAGKRTLHGCITNSTPVLE